MPGIVFITVAYKASRLRRHPIAALDCLDAALWFSRHQDATEVILTTDGYTYRWYWCKK